MDKKFLDDIVHFLKENDLRIVTAESCTAGLLASTLAEPSGCGAWLEAAYVTYSEEAKINALMVKEDVIDTYGLTSTEVASAMAQGALRISNANLAIATTGVAGPSAGDGQEPVGTVCVAWVFKSVSGLLTYSEKMHFDGERNQVRQAATKFALQSISRYYEKSKDVE